MIGPRRDRLNFELGPHQSTYRRRPRRDISLPAARGGAGAFAATPALPMSRRRDAGPWLGRSRRGVRHRGRLRRSSQLCHGAVGPAAGERGFSRRHRQPARLAQLRSLANLRTAAAVLCHQRGQHGLDDQSLHRQSESAQRRRVQSGRADRAAARSGHAGLLSARSRSVFRRAGDRRRRRGQLATDRSLRLLERQGPPVDHPRRQGRSLGVRHGGTADRRDCPAAGRGETVRDLRDMRGVVYRLGASEAAAHGKHALRCRATSRCRRTSRPLPR